MEMSNFEIYNYNNNPDDETEQKISSLEKRIEQMHKEMQQINNEIQSLKKLTDVVVNQNAKMLTALEKICENIRSPKANFPVSTVFELEELENKVKLDFEKYVILFKSILLPHGIHKYLNRILSEELCVEMNYSGLSNKKGLRHFESLNEALYESVSKDGYSMTDYVRDVRQAFQKIKNKKYKAVSLKKNLMRRHGNSEETEKENKESS